ncbi:hypothetical protein L486_02627 [Kwoniella mangroviensis CBS 10435]|uniref:Nudix hydrolase domain-containing protein n=1 Tax=Kwoniella mangroviensis CBS 10435 TaxID=1331196 RepID=A0A1B9IX01_9TREE|nr:hypothetical protein L486_02627 [Kwoniella mangroviensis CBS 10435]
MSTSETQAQTPLLNIIRSADHFPSFTTPYPTRHPLNDKRLLPLHLTLKDFQSRLPPIGLVPSDLLKDLKSEKGLQFFSILKKLEGKERELAKKAKDKKKNEVAKQQEQEEEQEKPQEEEEGVPEGEQVIESGGQDKEEKKKHKEDYKVIVLAIFFSDEVNKQGLKARTEVMSRVVAKWKDANKFPEAMKLWMNEPFPIYASTKSSMWQQSKEIQQEAKKPFGNVAFEIERAATPILGCTALGVHVTAYEGQGDEMKVWIPRRSANRIKSPLKYDSTVAGGIRSGHTPLQALLVECKEEAGWDEGLIKRYVRHAGMISLFQLTKWGGLAPGGYVFDLPLPSSDSDDYIKPQPNDEEVESFQLLSVPEVISALKRNEFKPTSAVVTIDFLIRHGFINPENEANYAEIVKRIHRRTGVAGPGY